MQHVKKIHGIRLRSSTGPHANISDQSAIDCSTLMGAASTGRVDILQYCRRAGLDVNMRADDGFTALHCAARSDQMEALTYLLRFGANANTYSDNATQSLPIYEAVSGRSLGCFKILLEANVELRSPDGSFKDLINCIVSTGDARFAQCFIENEENTPQNIGPTINAIALAAAGDGKLAIMHSLVSSHPEQVQIATNSRQSPLYLAAKRGHHVIVKLLLDLFESRSNDSKALSSLKALSLRPAAKRGHVDVVRLLLAPGSVLVNSLVEAANVAIENQQIEVLRLVAAAKDINGAGLGIDGALRLAVQCDAAGIVGYLASLQPFDMNDGSAYNTHNGKQPILSLALDGRHWACAEALLCSNNGNVNVADESGLNALHKAARDGHMFATRLLLQHKKLDVNRRTLSSLAQSALGLAITHNRVDIVETLLGHANIDVSSHSVGMNAVYDVAREGYVDMMSLLLRHHLVHLNSRDTNGTTALHSALKGRSIGMLEFLLRQPGIDPSPVMVKGETILDLILRESATLSNALTNVAREKMAQYVTDYEVRRLQAPSLGSETALELAERYERWSAFDQLLDHEQPGLLRQWFCKPRALQILFARSRIVPWHQGAPIPTEYSLHWLLEKGVISINAKRSNGMTLVDHAIDIWDMQLLQALLQHPWIRFGTLAQRGYSLAINAVRNGDLETVRTLCGDGFPRIDGGGSRNGVLCEAVKLGRLQIVQYLLASGCEFNISALNFCRDWVTAHCDDSTVMTFLRLEHKAQGAVANGSPGSPTPDSTKASELQDERMVSDPMPISTEQILALLDRCEERLQELKAACHGIVNGMHEEKAEESDAEMAGADREV